MRTLRPLVLLVFIAVLATPAATASPASGTLQVGGPLDLPQPSAMTAAELSLLWKSPWEAIVIEADAVEVIQWGTTELVVQGPLGPGSSASADTVDENARHDDARVTIAPLGDAPLLGIKNVGLATLDLAPAQVQPVRSARLVESAPADLVCDQRGCLRAIDQYAIQTAGVNGELTGTLRAILRGATASVESATGAATYESGETSRDESAATKRHDDLWVELRFTNARLLLADVTPALLVADVPSFNAPLVSAQNATGALDVGARTYRASEEALDARGTLRLVTLPFESSGFDPREEVAYADAFSASISGDVAQINLQAIPIYEETPAQTAGALAILAAIAASAAYFWPLVQFHATAALLPFYTRLSKPDILENEVRNHIFEIIRQNPGISARAIHRHSDQSWGTVVYHLRQLERHHVVVSRALGRTRNYYENHGKYRGMEAQLACLQSDRARALANLIVRSPGLTQELLVEQSGFPQPTTSYYVRKLKRAGLVDEAREGRYVRYLPKGDVARFIELAESAPQVPPPTAPPPANA